METSMEEFPTIERVNQILTEIADKIPSDLYQGLSGGIILLDQEKLHKEARNNDLYIMGEYVNTPREKQIKIYYGSFRKVFPRSSETYIAKKLEEVLVHELTHHLEARAGLKDLEVQDYNDIKAYKDKFNPL